MICLKIRTFVVSATTRKRNQYYRCTLWFAWKFVPLWYQQQLNLSNCIFGKRCDLLENSYLCGISNNIVIYFNELRPVVICLKIRTFVVSATTSHVRILLRTLLWFAWKFVPLWYQQQPHTYGCPLWGGCDLLENSYLCGISNNHRIRRILTVLLWFAWKFVPLWYQQQPVLASILSIVRCDLLENSYLCGISNNFNHLR